MAMPGSGGGSGRSMGRRQRRRPSSEINVTPLVDVMLVLLIIFMITAPMLSSGVNVDLPKTSANPVKMDSKPITISIKSDGSLYLGDTPIQSDSLIAALKSAAENDSTRRIFVRADAKIDYGQVMSLMGQITSSGFNHVALLAQQPPAAQ